MKARICFVLLAVVLVTARISFGKTLFGQNYTALYYSYFDYGDGDKSYLDDGQGGPARVQDYTEKAVTVPPALSGVEK